MKCGVEFVAIFDLLLDGMMGSWQSSEIERCLFLIVRNKYSLF